MATSEGWWLRIKDGKHVQVGDHATEVRLHPKTFGLTAKQVAALNPNIPEEHDLLRILACKNGWIRVRSGRALGTGVCLESFWSPHEDVIAMGTSFLRKMGFGPLTTVLFNDLKKRKTFEARLQEFDPNVEQDSTGFSAYENQKIDRLSAQADAILENRDEEPRATAARLFKEGGGTLADIATVKLDAPDADFWLQRNGTEDTVGTPLREYTPGQLGVKVTATDRIVPQYLFYVMTALHQRGAFRQMCNGTLKLKHIRAADVLRIPLG